MISYTDAIGTLGALVAYSIATGITPGPNNIYLLSVGARRGLIAGLPYLFGIVAGFTTLTAALALGLGAMFRTYPVLETALTLVACMFLLYLAWTLARTPPANFEVEAAGNPATNSQPHDPARKDLRHVGFIGAFFFQAINPKAWASSTAAISLFFTPVATNWFRTALEVVVFVGTTCVCSTLWLIFGVQLRRFLAIPKVARYFNLLMAGLLVATTALVIN